MNKKGAGFLGVIVALVIFMSGVLFIEHLETDITTTRIDLDCTNLSISDGTKLQCLVVGITVPYYFVLLLSLAGGFITEILT